MTIPLDKLVNLEIGRYEVAKACMKLAGHYSEQEDTSKNVDRLAVVCISKILNKDIKYEMKHDEE